jgi:hypothetical protein
MSQGDLKENKNKEGILWNLKVKEDSLQNFLGKLRRY